MTPTCINYYVVCVRSQVAYTALEIIALRTDAGAVGARATCAGVVAPSLVAAFRTVAARSKSEPSGGA